MEELKIALAGELRSGKSTLAKYAEETYDMTPFAFGDELKRRFHETFPNVPRDPKPREGYQMYGQLMRFVYGQDIWVNYTFDEIDRCRKAALGYNFDNPAVQFNPLVTDARQPNEFQKLRDKGFKIVKVTAPIELRIARAKADGDIFTEADLNHETELYVRDLNPDYLITNDGSLTDLYAAFDAIVEDIRKE